MSYLGKISAIVSANTSDFRTKIAQSSKDIDAWSKSVTTLIGRASSGASTSLRSIYTDAQKLARSLEAVKAGFLNYKGFDASDLGTAIGRMEALYSITKKINQPLSDAARSLEKLPDSIQAAFLPAMVSAQAATERLAAKINETGNASEAEFEAVAAKVDLVTASMRRLQEATGMVSRLSKGDSLKFVAPRQFDAFSAAEKAQSATSGISATMLSRFGVGEQQGKVAAAAGRVNDLLARRERRMSLGLSTARVDAMIEAETDRFEAQIRVLERRNEAAQKFALIVKGGFVSSDDLAKSAKGMDKGAFVLVEDLAKQAAQTRADVLRRLQNSSNFVSSDDLAKSAKGMDKGAFQPLGNLQKSAADLRTMQDEIRKAAAKQMFGGRFNESLNTSLVNSYTGKLNFLRETLIKLGATSGSAVQAVDAYANALERAQAKAGGLAANSKQVAAAEQAAIEAVGGVRGSGGARKIAEGTRRMGDLSRFGADKLSLAFQQAGFAIDDFFSSVGGADQKIRAISNNLTQMAFILGGTTGLFTGLAFVIGAQVALAINKFVFRSHEAEAAANALGNAIGVQKEKVKGLAGAYRDLGDSIAKSGMTKDGQQRFERQREFLERQQQGEGVAIESAAARSPRIAAARGLRDLAEKNRKEATSIDAVLRAAAAERNAADVVSGRERGILGRARAIAATTPRDVILAQQIRNRAALSQAEEVDAAEFFGDAGRRRRIRVRRERDAELEAAVALRRQQMGESLVAAGQSAESLLSPVSERMSELGFTRAGERVNQVFESMASAMQDFSSGRMSEESLAVFIDSLARSARAADAAAQPVLAFSDALKSLGSEPLRGAIDAARSREQALRQDAVRASGGASRGAEADRILALAMGEAASSGEARVAEARRAAESGLYQVEQEQSRFLARFEADLLSGRGPRGAVDVARRLSVQRSIASDENAPLALREQARVAADRLSARLRAIAEDLPESRDLRAKADGLMAGLASVIESVDQAARAAQEMADFDREVARRRSAVGDAMRGLDLSENPAQRAARDARQGAADISAAFDQRFRELADRGGGLPFAGQEEEARKLREEQAAAFESFAQSQARSAAPAIFEMADAVTNAVLQGPSRQALEMADVTTMEGSKELNRLLRGDDASKNANIVELQKQSQILSEIRDGIRDEARKAGVLL